MIGMREGVTTGRDHVRDQRIERVVPLVTPARAARRAAARRAARAGRRARARARSPRSSTASDDRLLVVVGPCSVHDAEAALEYAGRLARAAGRARRRPADRDARLLREAAHHDRLEGPDQRSRTSTARATSTPACGSRARCCSRCSSLGPAGRLRVPRPDHAAVHLRHRRLGRDRRAHDREPDPPPARLRPVDAGRLQEPHRRQRPGRGRRGSRGRGRRTPSPASTPSGTPAILHTRGNPDCHVILRGGREAPNYDARRRRGRAREAARRRAAGARGHRRLARQQRQGPRPPAGSRPRRSATQIAAGNEAIVGVMLESFLVAGRQDLGDGDARPTASRSPTPAWTGTTTVGGAGRASPARRARRAAAAMRIAVLGVGLIGGSIGLAARECARGRRGRRLRPQPRAARAGARARARSTSRPARSRRRSTARPSASAARRSARCRPDRRGARRRPARTASSPTSARPSGGIVDAVGRPSASSAATRSPAPRRPASSTPAPTCSRAPTWYLTPSRALRRASCYERLHRLVAALGARPIAIDAETHDRLLATVSHLPHVLANVLVAQAARRARRGGRARCRASARASATPRAWPAPTPAIWTDIYLANREAIAAEVDAVVARLAERRRRCCARGDAERDRRLERARPRDDRRRLLEADLAGGAVHELRMTVPNRPGIVAAGGARARQGGREHRGHGARARARHALRRDHALDRRRRRGRPRARARSTSLGFPVAEA